MSFEQWSSLAKQVALVLFFLTFVGIVIWAYWPSRRHRLEQIAKQILEDEENPPSRERDLRANRK